MYRFLGPCIKSCDTRSPKGLNTGIRDRRHEDTTRGCRGRECGATPSYGLRAKTRPHDAILRTNKDDAKKRPHNAILPNNKAKRRDITQQQGQTTRYNAKTTATRCDITHKKGHTHKQGHTTRYHAKTCQTTRYNAKTKANDAISRQKTSQTTRYHASTSQTRPYHATTRPTMRYYAEQGQTTPTMPTMPSLESLCMQMPSPRPRRRRRGGYPSRRRSP